MFMPVCALATPAPAYQWSGAYIGAQVGYGMSADDETYATGLYHYRYQAQGGSAGVFAGYNHILAGNWLAGVEVEGNGNSFISHYYDSYYGGNYYTQGWSLAARLRLGFLASPSTLFYGSIGVASGNLDYSKGYWAYYNSTGYSSPNATVTGVQFGAGVETFITPQVSVRAEGIFTHYGTEQITDLGNPYISSIALDTLVARVGISYHPGWLGQPAAEMPAPVRGTWSGSYVGGHLGATMFASAEDYDPAYSAPYNPAYGVATPVPGIGVFVGHNWQIGQFVAGVEADGALVNANIPLSSTPNYGTQSWQASVRARVGVVTAQNTLFYALIGAAAGGFDYSNYFTASSHYSGATFTGTGLQAGAGAEAFLTPKLSARIEGLYTDYGMHAISYNGGPYWVVNPRTFEARVGLSLHLN